MEVVGAAASFIAIGQALAGIPKLIGLIQSVANTREELEELLFELEVLSELHNDVQSCRGLLSPSDSSGGIIAPNEPAYIQRARMQLETLLEQVKTLAGDCQKSIQEQQHVTKTLHIRAKWAWKKHRVAELCERSRRIQGYLQSAMNALAFRYSIKQSKDERSERAVQTQLIMEVHAVATAKRSFRSIAHTATDSLSNEPSAEHPKEFLHSFLPDTYKRHPCTCVCHQLTGPRSPARISSMLGLNRPTELSHHMCTCTCSSRGPTYSIRFNLHRLIGQRALSFALSFYSAGDIRVSLQLPRILIPADDALTYIEFSDDKTATDFIQQRPYRPLDLDGVGIPLFEWAISFDKPGLILYWLQKYPYLLAGNNDIRSAVIILANRLDDWKHHRAQLPESEIYVYRSVIEISELAPDISSFPIHEGVRGTRGLVQAIQENPSRIDDLDDTWRTPLALACEYENYDAFLYLIKQGACLGSKNGPYGETALHVACRCGLTTYAQTLLEAGADVNARARDSMTALIFIIIATNLAGEKKVELVSLLLEYGASASAINTEHYSALGYLAMIRAEPRTIRKLFKMLMHSGDAPRIETKNVLGFTALDIAIEKSNTTMFRLLVQKGAKMEHGLRAMGSLARRGTCGILKCVLETRIIDNDVTRGFGRYGTPLAALRYVMFCSDENLSPGDRRPTANVVNLFEELLQDIRDRAIVLESALLESIINDIKRGNTADAREALTRLSEKKNIDKVYWEAETFRAIELDVRNGSMKLAVDSLEEFMDVSRARLDVSPFEEEFDFRVPPPRKPFIDGETDDGDDDDDDDDNDEFDEDDEDEHEDFKHYGQEKTYDADDASSEEYYEQEEKERRNFTHPSPVSSSSPSLMVEFFSDVTDNGSDGENQSKGMDEETNETTDDDDDVDGDDDDNDNDDDADFST